MASYPHEVCCTTQTGKEVREMSETEKRLELFEYVIIDGDEFKAGRLLATDHDDARFKVGQKLPDAKGEVTIRPFLHG